jgi:ABC-type bacteriocin/lantibiotic exporter with double-glycine peptidase domain
VVVLKDQKNKAGHAQSAHLACEAAGSIRTVAALTREDDCCEIYSQSLEGPLRESARAAIWSNLLFSLSQGFMFFVIALVFWYGSRLVSFLEYSTFRFFVGLMVRHSKFKRYLPSTIPFCRAQHSVPSRLGTFSPSYLMSRRHKARHPALSN